jgi:hypothetical protein
VIYETADDAPFCVGVVAEYEFTFDGDDTVTTAIISDDCADRTPFFENTMERVSG